MNSRFYKHNSGTRQVEEVFSGARQQAETFQKVLNEYTRFHMSAERLKELQPQLEEQTKKVDALRKELEEVERQVEKGKKTKHERKAIQEKYNVERDALHEMKVYCVQLEGVQQPEFPSWLVSFLREVMVEYV